MEQTLEDMLLSESSRFGRLKVWTRTLADLPLDATKERLTNGEETVMNRNMKYLLGAAIAAIIIVGVGSFWFGGLQAKQHVGIAHVNVAQLGDAMQQDDFYSTYGNVALLFSAKVATVTQGGQTTLVTFASAAPFHVSCQFPAATTLKTGQTVSVAAPGGSATRQKSGVLLHDCYQS